MSIEPPPIMGSLADNNGLATIPWIEFFNTLFEGDGGDEWIPVFTNLTTVGTPTITGRYYRINQSICLLFASIVPATSTTSTAASTYIGNFPLTFSHDGVCFASTGDGAIQAIGGISSSNNRIYTPAWTAVTTGMTIFGIAVAR